jgi:hypothetical protein
MIALLPLLALVCGVEAWPAKILADRGAAAALAPAIRPATIAELGALPRRAPRRAYVTTGRILVVKLEADGDFHMVLGDDRGHTIIAELPDPQCAMGSKALAAISRARLKAAALRVGQRVRLVGMIFFDRPHRMSGNAPNYAELHPVLSVRRIR